jgi:hypothetical protein
MSIYRGIIISNNTDRKGYRFIFRIGRRAQLYVASTLEGAKASIDRLYTIRRMRDITLLVKSINLNPESESLILNPESWSPHDHP